MMFCADTPVNKDPDEDVLAEVAHHTAELAREFNVEPGVAMLSYSNFGSIDDESARTCRRAAARLREEAEFPVDGEMQADTAPSRTSSKGPTSSPN